MSQERSALHAKPTRAIRPLTGLRAEVSIPGSKSYTHRLLIAAALAHGQSHIRRRLISHDTDLTLAALRRMGVAANEEGETLILNGEAGRLTGGGEVFLGNSGTSMRLLCAVAALAQGDTVFSGTDRMHGRPIGELLDALTILGVPAVSLEGNGCPPVRITGGRLAGGETVIDCGVSSQYLSGLLLIAPHAEKGLDIRVSRGPVSRPYIDMTLEVMERLGVSVERDGYERFRVAGGQCYRAGDYRVEPDASNASYFWAAAAVTGGTVTVRGLDPDGRQGDLKLLDHLAAMGCQVLRTPDAVTVVGGPLRAIDVDMGDMPDMVPTLAVVAAFAQGVTRIRNVAHLKAKECDRMAAVAAELTRMGATVTTSDDAMTVTGGPMTGAEIHTYDDHRMAMAFAVAGLAVPGVVIHDPGCVGKSFPEFWTVFDSLAATE